MSKGNPNFGAKIGNGNTGVWTKIQKVKRQQHTGSVTNDAVRKWVNLSTTAVPKRVKLSLNYTSDDGTQKLREMIVANPRVARGKRYDAGHRFGQQYGGSGTKRSNLFPQHPTVNRYPAKGAIYTESQNWNPKRNVVNSWRRMEDKIRRKIDKYKSVEARFDVLTWHR